MTEETQEVPTEAEAMGEVWDKLQAEGIEEEEATEEVAEETTEERPRGPDGKFVAKADDATEEVPEVEGEADAGEVSEEPSEPPAHLPEAVRTAWAAIPDAAKDAISASHKELGDKLTDMGRKVSAIGPIYETVVQAAQELPQMASMTPAQIAGDVMELARVQARLGQDPVGTIMDVAARYGAVEGLKEALTGEKGTADPQLTQIIARMSKQIEAMNDPSRLSAIVDGRLTEQTINNEITNFAASAEHYDAVADYLPQFIEVANGQLGPNASNADVLGKAYEMAVSAFGLRATPTPADPKQTQAAIKAKSVNVTSRSAGKTKPMTERQKMAQVYDRMTGT